MNRNQQTQKVQLHPEPLTKQNFARFGEVIEASDKANNQMNSGTFARFDNLATVTAGPGSKHSSNISIVRSEGPSSLPYDFTLVEKHPLCSQAFIPLNNVVFYVVVGPRGNTVEANELEAFVTNGRQGISYFPGTWHMPLISLAQGQEFLVVDQAELPGNLVELNLPQAVTLGVPRC